MKKKKKIKISTLIEFFGGLILYLIGLFLLFISSISKLDSLKKIFFDISLTNNAVMIMKVLGSIFFIVGFIIFIIGVIRLYKYNDIRESNVNLLIEGQADVVTLIVMTYILIIMLVLCLAFDQIIGALLFGLAIIIQNVLNKILLKYFKSCKKRRV